MGKPAADMPEDKLALYEKLVATQPDVKRKGAKVPYTSRNGHMFSFLTQDGQLALRLPKEEQEAFVAKYKTPPCMQYGRVMRGYVMVPDALLKNTRTLKKYFALSYDYIGTLKPKPTTRKKAAAKKKASTKKTAAKKKASTKKAAAKKKASVKKTTAKKKAPAKKTVRKKKAAIKKNVSAKKRSVKKA